MFRILMVLLLLISPVKACLEDDTPSGNSFAQKKLSENLSSFLDSQIERPLNGVVLIAKEDEVLFEKVAGHRGSPTLESRFLIGSVSKQITAALVLRAVEQNLLALDAPLKKYLPDITHEWGEHVTLHHLLNHTSGFKSLEEGLEFTPGARFSYCNGGYDLLGTILKEVTDKSYNLLANELFKTLDMNNSLAHQWEENADYPFLQEGYIENEEGEVSSNTEKRQTSSNPSGGLISTVYDLLKWNQTLHGGKLFENETYQIMITPSAQREHRWGTLGYGYGVHINTEGDVQEITHNGIISGYLSTLIYYPQNKVSIIILENNVLWTKEWNLEIKKKVFYLHDGIREIVKKADI